PEAEEEDGEDRERERAEDGDAERELRGEPVGLLHARVARQEAPRRRASQAAGPRGRGRRARAAGTRRGRAPRAAGARVRGWGEGSGSGSGGWWRGAPRAGRPPAPSSRAGT